MGKKKDALAADAVRAAKKLVTTIRPCGCFNTYQDEKYGVNMRVHNVGRKGDSCTVCAKLK